MVFAYARITILHGLGPKFDLEVQERPSLDICLGGQGALFRVTGSESTVVLMVGRVGHSFVGSLSVHENLKSAADNVDSDIFTGDQLGQGIASHSGHVSSFRFATFFIMKELERMATINFQKFYLAGIQGGPGVLNRSPRPLHN